MFSGYSMKDIESSCRNLISLVKLTPDKNFSEDSLLIYQEELNVKRSSKMFPMADELA